MQSIRKSGKTNRDRANGSPQKNASNKASRASWLNSGHKESQFPAGKCFIVDYAALPCKVGA